MPQWRSSLLPSLAERGLGKAIMRATGLLYTKSGVILDDLIQQELAPVDLFAFENSNAARLSAAMHAVNDKWGKKTLIVASEGFKRPFDQSQHEIAAIQDTAFRPPSCAGVIVTSYRDYRTAMRHKRPSTVWQVTCRIRSTVSKYIFNSALCACPEPKARERADCSASDVVR